MAGLVWLPGDKAAAYYGDAEAALAAMTEITNVRDVTVNMDAKEVDVGTRKTPGWEGTAAGRKTCSVDFEMLWLPGDPAFLAIRSAFLSGGVIEMAFLDQKRDVVGAQGPKGLFSITNFKRNESLTEGITASVTAKLTEFREWVETAG